MINILNNITIVWSFIIQDCKKKPKNILHGKLVK